MKWCHLHEIVSDLDHLSHRHGAAAWVVLDVLLGRLQEVDDEAQRDGVVLGSQVDGRHAVHGPVLVVEARGFCPKIHVEVSDQVTM